MLLLGNISSIQTLLEEPERIAIPIKLGTPVEFNETHNYFKFDFTGSADAKISISVSHDTVTLNLTDPMGEKRRLEESKDVLVGNLSCNGTYYLEVIYDELDELYYQIEGIFNTVVIGSIMDIVDLNKIFYTNNVALETIQYYGYIEYKIINLTEDKIIYFTNSKPDEYYYPYYPN